VPSPSPSPSPAPSPKPSPASNSSTADEGADGVYLFASTLVVNEGAEAALNATLRGTAQAGQLLKSLQYTAGEPAGCAALAAADLFLRLAHHCMRWLGPAGPQACPPASHSNTLAPPPP
jgi:hypothetical protein